MKRKNEDDDGDRNRKRSATETSVAETSASFLFFLPFTFFFFRERRIIKKKQSDKASKWQEIWDERYKRNYYYNSETGESVWVKPAGFVPTIKKKETAPTTASFFWNTANQRASPSTTAEFAARVLTHRKVLDCAQSPAMPPAMRIRPNCPMKPLKGPARR